ncbi:AraC family transcriptional regulator [Paraburkholderia sp. GAS199]|uniref:helix-turn-helix transcriptional regulator n=1 Tax=Paraburkholderia sp. GAS199 TaxID=3035126 RepID=UPI003D1E58A0
MKGHEVWDGNRPLSERVVIARRQLLTDGMVATLATENVEAPTDWCFEGSHHTVVVHLAGRLRRMESTFSVGPSSKALPAIGDIWAIPAGCRYAALAHGDQVKFAEFTLPAGLPDDGALKARVGHHDPFLYQAARKLSQLATRDDDLARMARDALLQVLHFHLRDAYLRQLRSQQSPQSHHAHPSPARPRDSARRFSEREARLLAERIADMAHCPVSLDELAALLDMSVAQLSRSFKASFGTTPWQYVLGVRMEKAVALLRTSTASVTEIAVATGFSSPSHFATAFLKHYGTSPSAYRRERSR